LRFEAEKRIGVIFIVIIMLLQFGMVVSSQEKQEPVIRESIHRFFNLVHQRKYRDAYNLFSRSVRRDISFTNFMEGAQDVKYLKILTIDIQDVESNLAKTRISALIHVNYQGSLYEAEYEGQVTLYRENNIWKVLAVNLEAKSQKSLDKKTDPGQLQKLDFGTK
jgi:hypothetical protein